MLFCAPASAMALAASAALGHDQATFAPLAAAAGPVYPMSALPVLESLPGAPATLFLDFDGDVARPWSGRAVPATPAFDRDGAPDTFDDAELAEIRDVWARVAEIYSPFNLNVTTVPSRDEVASPSLHVVIGGDGAWYDSGLETGIALVDNFGHTDNAAYVFSKRESSPTLVAYVAAHEAGHGFGLQHQRQFDASGNLVQEYNPGSNRTSPIMGDWPYHPIWWYGPSASATQFQDDMAVIAGPHQYGPTFGYRPDDHGDTPAAGTALTFGPATPDAPATAVASGLIRYHTDQDWFTFAHPGGPLTLRVEAAVRTSMLDARLELRDAAGATVASAETLNLGETLNVADLPAGNYAVLVAGSRRPFDTAPDPAYGSVGTYTLRAERAATDGQAPLKGRPAFVSPAATTTIQIEDWDLGDEGVAYHTIGVVASDGSSGYRSGEFVSLQDRDGVVAAPGLFRRGGEWLEYTLDVADAGTYSVNYRIERRSYGQQVHLEKDGIDLTGPVTLANPGSGASSSFTTVPGGYVTLPAGRQVLRLVFDFGDATFDAFTLTPVSNGGQAPYGPAPVAVPSAGTTTVEAERYDRGGEGIAFHDLTPANTRGGGGAGGFRAGEAVDVAAVAGASDGLRVGDVGAGEWLEYTLDLAAAGTYDLEFLAGSESQAAGGAPTVRLHAKLDGVNVTGALTTSAGGAGVTARGVPLPAGRHVLNVTFDDVATAPAYLDAVRLTPALPPVVTVAATDATAAWADGDDGTFVVTRAGGSAATDLLVRYSLGGTADPNSDYAYLDGTVVIPAGAASAVVRVVPRQSLSDPAESVVLTLEPDGPFYAVGGASATAAVTIRADDDPPRVTVTASDPVATESASPADNGEFTVTRTGSTARPLLVRVGLGGTATPDGDSPDYRLIGATGQVLVNDIVVIPAGSVSAKVSVAVGVQAYLEGDETVVMTAVAGADYLVGLPASATVVIRDYFNGVFPVVGVAARAPAPALSEAGAGGAAVPAFDLRRDAVTTNELRVYFRLGGPATPGVDYLVNAQPVAPGSDTYVVTMPAGVAQVTLALTPLDDARAEGDERIDVTVLSDTFYRVNAASASAAATLADNEPVIQQTLRAVADAYVRDGASAGTNFGAGPTLNVKLSGGAGATRESYLRFDLSNVSNVTSAVLRLWGGLSADGESVGVAAYGVAEVGWAEGGINWNNRPAASGTTPVATATMFGTVAKWYEWDLTAYLKQQKAAGAAAATVVLRGTAISAALATFDSDESPTGANRPQLAVKSLPADTTAPAVAQVLAGGSAWSAGFLAGLKAAGLGDGGFAVSPSPAPTGVPPLPWSGFDRVRLRFSEDVTVAQGDLQVRGAAGTAYAFKGFAYDPATFTATWTLAGPLTKPDRLQLTLRAGVADRAGNATSGPFSFRYDVLPGDATRDGRVDAMDELAVRTSLGRNAASPTGYRPFADINGDGSVNAFDFALARAAMGTRLPAVTPFVATSRITLPARDAVSGLVAAVLG